jgi:hypothetical protein
VPRLKLKHRFVKKVGDKLDFLISQRACGWRPRYNRLYDRPDLQELRSDDLAKSPATYSSLNEMTLEHIV